MFGELGEGRNHPIAPVLATWLLVAQGAAEAEPAAVDNIDDELPLDQPAPEDICRTRQARAPSPRTPMANNTAMRPEISARWSRMMRMSTQPVALSRDKTNLALASLFLGMFVLGSDELNQSPGGHP